jgi:hypothetical protein
VISTSMSLVMTSQKSSSPRAASQKPTSICSNKITSLSSCRRSKETSMIIKISLLKASKSYNNLNNNRLCNKYYLRFRKKIWKWRRIPRTVQRAQSLHSHQNQSQSSSYQFTTPKLTTCLSFTIYSQRTKTYCVNSKTRPRIEISFCLTVSESRTTMTATSLVRISKGTHTTRERFMIEGRWRSYKETSSAHMSLA